MALVFSILMGVRVITPRVAMEEVAATVMLDEKGIGRVDDSNSSEEKNRVDMSKPSQRLFRNC